MDNINNYLTFLNDNLSGLIHDDIQPFFLDYKKINIYNKNIHIPAQKIWIEVPKLKMSGKLFLNNKSKQYALLPLILYDLDSEIEKFKLFIENIEDKIFKLVDEISENELAFKSSIKYSENYYPTFILQLPFLKKNNNIEFLFDIYDIHNKKISYEKIINGCFVKSFIELSEVWMNKNEFGINWKVLQMKIYPEFNFQKCLFVDEITQFFDDKHSININSPPTPPLSPIKLKSHIIKENLKFVPTINELINVKNNLKKINYIKKSETLEKKKKKVNLAH